MTDRTHSEALRLANEFKLCNEYDSIPSMNDIAKAEAELRRQHTENATLQQGYDAARLEIDSLQARVQELGAMLRENRCKRIAELEAQLEAIGAGGVEPLRRRECLHKISEPETAAKPPAGWWRQRADEIELEVAQGKSSAMRCYTDMRALLQAAAAPKPEPAAVAGHSDLVTRESAMQAIEHVAIHNSGSREREAVEMLASAPATKAAPGEPDPADILAGALQISRGHAIEMMREALAASLTCWHRLTGQEADELVALFQGHPAQAAPVAVAGPSNSEIDALVASIGPTEGTRRDSRDLTMDKLRVLVRRALATWGHVKAAPAAQGDAEDAARYRCIRRGQHWSVIDGSGNELRAEALDAAIDAAMKAGGAA